MADFYSEIYNQESKERFLDSIDINQYPPRWWERVFEKSFIFEKLKDKDLYSFTVPEILEFYKFLDIGRLAPLVIYNTNLVIYAQWALNENLVFDGQNHFDEINNETLNTCVNKTKIKKSIFDYDKFIYLVEQQIVNEQDKYILFCMFEGIKGKNYEEIIKLRMSDIDEVNKTATLCSGRTIAVSQKFIDICKRADKQTTYMGLTDNAWDIELQPSMTIYKQKNNSRGLDDGRAVYKTIVRNITYLGLNDVITGNSLRDSGMIYYLKQRAERNGETIEELLYNNDEWEDIRIKYNFNINTRNRWLLQFKDIL